jgi:hypothetical protein
MRGASCSDYEINSQAVEQDDTATRRVPARDYHQLSKRKATVANESWNGPIPEQSRTVSRKSSP